MYRYLGSINMHNFFVFISGISLLIHNLLQIRKKKQFPGKVAKKVINRLKNEEKYNRNVNLIIAVEIMIISFFQYVLAGGMNNTFRDVFGTGANYYGLLLTCPLFVSFICFIMGSDVVRTIDLISPVLPLSLFFSKLGCFCSGCCRGFDCSFGMLNHKTGDVEFPVQLVEAALALAIFVFLMYYKKKAKSGTIYPLYLIMYSATRFFSEFLREEPDVFWILKTYHLLCLAGIVLGLIQLFIALKFADKISLFFDKAFDGIGVFIKKTAIEIDLYEEEKEIVHHKKKKKK